MFSVGTPKLIILVDKMHSLVSWLAETPENYGMDNELNNS